MPAIVVLAMLFEKLVQILQALRVAAELVGELIQSAFGLRYFGNLPSAGPSEGEAAGCDLDAQQGADIRHDLELIAP
jgi:hypothetical protein